MLDKLDKLKARIVFAKEYLCLEKCREKLITIGEEIATLQDRKARK